MAGDSERHSVVADDAPRFRLVYSAGVFFLAAIVAAFVVPRVAPEPHAFTGGDFVGGAAKVGEPVWFDMGTASRGVVVRHAVPVFADGSARASVDVFVCRQRVAHKMLGTDKGWNVLRAQCLEWRPAVDTRMERFQRNVASPYLVMAVVPLEKGMVRIRGVRVTHSGRWRDTTERSGSEVYVRAV